MRSFVVVELFQFTRTNRRMDDSFGYWFSGFVDGEACFLVQRRADLGTVSCKFAITLRADDLPLLHMIKEKTGFGVVRVNKKTYRTSNLQAHWTVSNKPGCLGLVEIFDRYPLQSKKVRDYMIWRDAVFAWHEITRGKTANWDRMYQYADQIKAIRAYQTPVALT